MRILVVLFVVFCAGCGLIGSEKPPPATPEIVVTGAPIGSLLIVDGVRAGEASTVSDRSQILYVTAGLHKVEVQVGDVIVFREDAYVGNGEVRNVRVLSGLR